MLKSKTYNNNKSEWVILLHAFGGNSRCFKKQIEPLSKWYNVLTIDMHGHGESWHMPLKNTNEKNIKHVAEKVLEVLNYNGIDKAHFVGLSLGTIVCAILSKYHNSRVMSLTCMGDATSTSKTFKMLVPIGQASQRLINYKLTYFFFANMLIPGKVHKVSRKFLIQEALKIGHEEFFTWYEAIVDFYKNESQDSFLDMSPTHYIMGSKDIMFAEACKKNIQKKQLKNCRYTEIDGAGHVVNMDATDAVNREMIDFLLEQSSKNHQICCDEIAVTI